MTDDQYILMRELITSIHKLAYTSLTHLEPSHIFAAMTQALIEAASVSPHTDEIIATCIEGLNQSEAMVKAIKERLNG